MHTFFKICNRNGVGHVKSNSKENCKIGVSESTKAEIQSSIEKRNTLTKCVGSRHKSMYSASFAPTILIFGLYQTFILGLFYEIGQKKVFLMVKFRTVGIPRNNDVGPVVSASYVQS